MKQIKSIAIEKRVHEEPAKSVGIVREAGTFFTEKLLLPHIRYLETATIPTPKAEEDNTTS